MARSAALAVVLSSLLLSSCGFQPLYAGPSSPVAAALADVAVNPPDTRTGQLFREEFDDETARSTGGAPRYRLDIAIDERRFARGLRIDDTANRFELRLNVRYRLVNLSNGRAVTRGDEPIYVTYDVADQPYAGVAAHLDGQERAASEAAVRIRQNLSRFFAERAGVGGPGPAR